MRRAWLSGALAAAAVFLAGAASLRAQAVSVRYDPGNTRKVCQVTGETDRERGQPTANRTQSRFGVMGTDLGASVEHEGRLYFLFGDTIGPGRAGGEDSVAVSTDGDPEDCLSLEFVTERPGRFLSPRVPGVSLGPFEVPSGGFSAGGRLYAFFTTDHTPQRVMGRSVLASTADGGRTFRYHYDLSRDRFINVAPAVVANADVPGLPETQGQGVLLWGSGTYRKSDPYLAYAPLTAVEDRAAVRYYAGLDATGRPRWSRVEADAAPLFAQPCLGELSVAWNRFLRRWLMLYNCDGPARIVLRSAEQPWGPWSAPVVVFHPWDDGGYCRYIHVAWSERNCDAVHDPGREQTWGGPYGPYVIPRFTTGDESRTTIYYLLSTWNPYNVVLMKTTLVVGR